MFYEFIPIILLAILTGILTGLIPGLHINMVSSFILANFFILNKTFQTQEIIIFILTMGTVHTFIDFIPSILFGIPNSDTSISILPAHKMVLQGQALKAIFLSSFGSLTGLFFAFIISPIFYWTLPIIYNSIKNSIPYILITITIILILSEKEKNKIFWATIIVLFSGALGLLTLNSSLIKEPLLILFSGIFGLSNLIISLKNNTKIPEQKLKFNFKFEKNYLKAILISGTSSSFCAISPGIGNAQAASISSIFLKKQDSQIIIYILSSINTINFILSFLTFYLIDRARNGSVLVISQISQEIRLQDLLLYFSIIFIIGIISFFITLYLGKFLIKKIFKINFKLLNILVITFITLFIFFLTNIYAILILITSTILGILCIQLNLKRTHLMSVLLIPVIFNLI